MANIKRGILASASIALLAIVAAFPATAQKKIEIKIGSVTIKETNHHWMLTFKKNIERRIGNRVNVRVFPAAQLGGIHRQIEGVQLGTQQMFVIPLDFLVGVDKRYMVASAPGLFGSLRHAQKALHDPEFKKMFFSMGAKKGISLVGLYCGDLAHYVSIKPIKRLADFKNKKIRVFASLMERETMRRLGASPAPIPLMDALQALQRGTVDSMKTGISLFVAFKFWNVTKHLTRSQESIICVAIIANPAWLQKLPKDVRQVILKEARNTDWSTLTYSEAFLANSAVIWKKNGGVIYDLQSAEREEMRKRLLPVGAAVVKDLPAVKKVFDRLKVSAAKHR